MAERANIQIPRSLYAAARKAIRLACRDSRAKERVLHDETRQALSEAQDAIDDFQDLRVAGEQ